MQCFNRDDDLCPFIFLVETYVESCGHRQATLIFQGAILLTKPMIAIVSTYVIRIFYLNQKKIQGDYKRLTDFNCSDFMILDVLCR